MTEFWDSQDPAVQEFLDIFKDKEEEDPYEYLLDKHIEEHTKYEVDVTFQPPPKLEDIDAEIEQCAKESDFNSVEELLAWADEMRTLIGKHSNVSYSTGSPLGYVIYVPPKLRDTYKVHDFCWWKGVFGHFWNYVYGQPAEIDPWAAKAGHADIVNLEYMTKEGKRIPNPFKVEKQRMIIDLPPDDLDTPGSYQDDGTCWGLRGLDGTNTNTVQTKPTYERFSKLVAVMGELCDENFEWVVNAMIHLKADMMTNKKLQKMVPNAKERKKIYSALDYYEKMRKKGLCKKWGFNKVKEKAAKENNVDVKIINTILGTRSGYLGKKI